MAKKTQNTAKKTNKTVKKTAAKDAEWKLLSKELESLIPQLDSEGLAFLVEQGRIHLYNMQVDRLNQAAIDVDAAAAARTASRTKAKPKSADGNFRLAGTDSGSSFYLYYLNNDVMFSRDEFIHMIKMINAGGTDLEIRERLFNWFDRERRDVFAVVPVADKFDERFKAFVAFLKKNKSIVKLRK